MMVWLLFALKFVVPRLKISKDIHFKTQSANFLNAWKVKMAVACVGTAGVPQRSLQSSVLGERNFRQQSWNREGRPSGPPGPPGGPAGDFSAAGSSGQVSGSCLVVVQVHRALQLPWAVCGGLLLGVGGQCGAPGWPGSRWSSVCSRLLWEWQEHHPPRAGLQVCTQRSAQSRG